MITLEAYKQTMQARANIWVKHGEKATIFWADQMKTTAKTLLSCRIVDLSPAIVLLNHAANMYEIASLAERPDVLGRRKKKEGDGLLSVGAIMFEAAQVVKSGGLVKTKPPKKVREYVELAKGIRDTYHNTTCTMSDIARQFRVSCTMVSKIIDGVFPRWYLKKFGDIKPEDIKEDHL